MGWKTPRMLGMVSLVLAITHGAPLRAAALESPPVKAWVRSSWPAPNILLEVIESVALEYPQSYFEIFDLLASPSSLPGKLNSLTSSQVYDHAISRLASHGHFEEPTVQATLELSISLHAATPKIEAFYQFYTDKVTSSKAQTEGQTCLSWVDWYGQVACNIDDLEHLLEAESGKTSTPHPKILSFDHINPSPETVLESPARTAILYVSLESGDYFDLHKYLYTLSNKAHPQLQYIIRYVAPSSINSDQEKPRNYLSGYGVALDLKKTDYLALDDRHRSNSDTQDATETVGVPASRTSIEEDALFEALSDLPEVTSSMEPTIPLTEDEITSLGHKVTYLIVNASDPLSTLSNLSQNFPKFATTLARKRGPPPEEIVEEIQGNQLQLPTGFNGLWLNGLIVQEADVNPFALLRLLRKERRTIGSLLSLGLSPSQAVDLISFPAIGRASQSSSSSLEDYFDASDRIEGGGILVWWNDIEKDSRYSQWPTSLSGLMRQHYPGQFPSVRRNVNNIITVLDLSSPTAVQFIVGPVPGLINRNLPFRFGVVPIVETPDSERAARLFYYSVKNFGRIRTIKIFTQLADPQRQTIDFTFANQLISEAAKSASNEDKTVEDFDIVTSYSEEIEKAKSYSQRLGTSLAASQTGHAFINGKHVEYTEDFLRSVQNENGIQTAFITEQMYAGTLEPDDETDMSVFFYDLPTTAKRRNKYVYPAAKAGGLKAFNLPELFKHAGLDSTAIDYVYPGGSRHVPLTVWIIGDLNAPSNLALTKEALKAVVETSVFRIAFLHVPNSVTDLLDPGVIPRPSSILYRLSSTRSLRTMSAEGLLRLLEELPSATEALELDSDQQVTFSSQPSLNDILLADIAQDYHAHLRSTSLLGQKINLAPKEVVIMINGRVVGPIEAGGFLAGDFETLALYEGQKRVTPVIDALNSIYADTESFERSTYAELVAMSSSITSAAYTPDPSSLGLFNAPPPMRQRPYRNLAGTHSSFQLGNNLTSIIQVGVLLDPLSPTAQKWSPLLKWLSGVDSVHLHIVFNPSSMEPELPIKRFYRYNLQPRLTFDGEGSERETSVEFRGLPIEPIYTLAMDVSPSWLVRPRESPHDLDNIHLSSLSGSEKIEGVEAAFDLDFLVIEGHAREQNNAPPRGVQLQLTTSESTPIADTLIMANLGYLQFRAKPGVFKLDIRPGRGREVFEMESVGNEGWESPLVDIAGSDVTLTSFEGLTLYPRLKRRTGMEAEDVLNNGVRRNDEGVVEQLINRVKSFINPQTEVANTNPQADINIFTVASGLLYERFVGIMILGVMKNTKSSVKFWFIENFLSPSFLEFIPHLAEAYGFQYELVTYKWPSWLRAQTEKQRVIWGYKILFLDVLFPMDLKKVIFVDADQIVRADLQELVDLDLHGAPYGYTPMGDDNEDMEGFRFWKTGYWHDYLRGKPYHISALYVIDLVRFRQLAAGDRLRGQYQGLSADPNSLSNLDQDLPNNMQHEIPIFSLDKNWLWCETWCSKDRFSQAKTIDLCQNPLTKEPKLARARQIPEWEEYDSEIANFAKSLVAQGKVRSQAAAASVNDLVPKTADKPAEENGSEGEREVVHEEL